MLIIGVHKAFNHAGKRISHRANTRKRYKVYYIDENTAKFGSFFTDPLTAGLYKLQKCKRRTVICLACGEKNLMYYKNQKELEKTPCPGCGHTDQEAYDVLANALAGEV